MSELFIGPHDPLFKSSSTVVIDTTAYAPDEPFNAKDEYNKQRLPGARFWDIEYIAEPNEDGFMLMMPSAERFATYCASLGITPQSHVVVYDSHGNNRAAPRAVLTFKVGFPAS